MFHLTGELHSHIGYRNQDDGAQEAKTFLPFRIRGEKVGVWYKPSFGIRDRDANACEVYRRAMESGMDFYAVTPHSHFIDQTFYADLVEQKNKFNHVYRNKFVGLHGQEFGYGNNPCNHVCVYNNDCLCRLDEVEGFRQLYEGWIPRQGDVKVIQFNHPWRTPMGTGYGLDQFDSEEIFVNVINNINPLVEVFGGYHKFLDIANARGDIFQGVYHYLHFLSRGLYVCPSASSNTHRTDWGKSFSCRTVVIANSFTEEGIYEAIRNRKVYVVEYPEIRMEFSLVSGRREYGMGSIVRDFIEEDGNFLVKVWSDGADIDYFDIEVYRGSTGISEMYPELLGSSRIPSGEEVEMEVSLKKGFYFLAVNSIKGKALSSCIWVRNTRTEEDPAFSNIFLGKDDLL